jgi:hypothetical protein
LAQGDWQLLWGEDFQCAGFFQMSVDLEVLEIIFGFVLIFGFVVWLVFGDGFEEVTVLGHGWD